MKRAVILLSLLFAASSVVADVVVTMTGSLAYTGGISNIAVGDSYTLTLRYDPTQAPTSSETYPGCPQCTEQAFYSNFSLSMLVHNAGGNQSFQANPNQWLRVRNDPTTGIFDAFMGEIPSGSSYAVWFTLSDYTSTALDSIVLPTSLSLSSFENIYTPHPVAGIYLSGHQAYGNIDTISVQEQAPVSEPASALFLGGALLALGRKLRKRS